MSTKKGTKQKSSEARFIISLSGEIERLRVDAQALAETIVLQEITSERLRVIRLTDGHSKKHLNMVIEADASAEG